MRAGLPHEFSAQARAQASRPVNLLVFRFASGNVYLSDRDLGAADGLSHDYQGLVLDWGRLSDLPVDESGVAETRELTLTLWNGGEPPFSDRFQDEDPEAVEVELWQWFALTPESAAVLVDVFAVSDPIAWSEAGRELRLDLVSLSARLECRVGGAVEAADWPKAPEASLGRMVPLVFGSVPGVPCVCVQAPAEARLAASLLATDTAVIVDDAGAFPATGVVQIDEERLLYRSRDEETFTITKRGHANTLATDHVSGRPVCEVADYVFAAARGPVQAVSEVRVAGLPPETPYSVQTAADPATITFEGRPRTSRLSEATRFLEMQFDAVASGNSALHPELAFDDAHATTAAELDGGHPELRLVQLTANPDRGALRRVWLAVEHFESERLPHDYVSVEVPGPGLLGRLSAPHPEDGIGVEADVDIDHGHSHSLAAEHTHVFTDRQETIHEEAHSHATVQEFGAQLSNNLVKGWAYNFDAFGNKIYWTGLEEGQYVTATFTGLPSSGRARLEVVARKCPVFLGQWPRGTYRDGRAACTGVGHGDKLLDTDCQRITDQIVGSYALPGPQPTIYLSAEKKYCWTATWGYAEILSVKQYVTPDSSAVKTGVSLQVLDPGRNLAVQPLTGGVQGLATANVALTNKSESKASRTSVDYFDLTPQAVPSGWGWFTGCELRLRYIGSSDQRTCYVLHAWFEVEYSPREVDLSGEVTCRVEGLIDDAAGSITGTPGRLIHRPDEVRKYLLVAVAGLDPARIDSDSFGAAATRYSELGYCFDLALMSPGGLKELERGLARQCRSRFYWDAGLAKIAFRERDTDLAPVRQIGPEMVLSGSLRAERGRLANLANQVSLCYRLDPVSKESGAAAYLASLRGRDECSIAVHGARERPADFLFDAVREPGMAADLLAFYLEKEGRLATSYTFDCFLDAFELEKEDAVRLTHAFDNLSGNLAVVRSAARLLGSGTAGRPDLVRVTAELLPRRHLVDPLSEAVRAGDALSACCALDLHLADAAHPAAGPRLSWQSGLSAQLSAAETLAALHDTALSLSESAAPDEALRLSLLTPAGLLESLSCEERLAISIGENQVGGLGDGTGAADAVAVSLAYAQGLGETASAGDALTVKLGGGFGKTPFGTSPYGR